MYCKQCGHRTEEKTDTCPKCGVKLASELVITPAAKSKIRVRVIIMALVAAVVAFVIIPRFFLRTDLETIGPTDKLRFLRAMDRSDYRRAGQRAIHVEGQTLIVIWDLRWNVLPETKQQEIVRIVGRAWHVVGGEDTRFRIEGEDKTVASYP